MFRVRSDPELRSAGAYARATVQRLRLRTLLALGLLAIITAYVGRTVGLDDPLFLTAEIGLLLAILIVLHSILPLVERRERGASGEEEVGSMLQDLIGEGWQVLHDVSFGHGNVDHLLLGTGGIFTIETKSHPGPIVVRQIHGATLAQVRSEQKLIEQLTGEAVEPLLVYSHAWIDRPLARRKGVRIVPARLLAGYLSRQRATLSAAEVERAKRRIFDAAEKSGSRPARELGRGGSRHAISLRIHRAR